MSVHEFPLHSHIFFEGPKNSVLHFLVPVPFPSYPLPCALVPSPFSLDILSPSVAIHSTYHASINLLVPIKKYPPKKRKNNPHLQMIGGYLSTRKP